MTFCLRTSMCDIQKRVAGRRVWVAGCGPTLDDVDLRAIRPDFVLCLNAAATLFTRHRDSWWFFRDLRAFQECAPRLEKTWPVWRVITHRKASAQVVARGRRGGSMTLCEYNLDSVVHKRTVLEDALQVLDLAGVAEAYLVGVDHAVRDFKPYAKGLSWKKCQFYRYDRPDLKMKPVSRPLTNMAKIMGELVPRLKMKVYNTSTIYPIDGIFEKVTYEESVEKFKKDRN